MKKYLRIHDILENTQKIDLQLTLIAGSEGLDKAITAIEINRPGLTLAGFFDYFAFNIGLGYPVFPYFSCSSYHVINLELVI